MLFTTYCNGFDSSVHPETASFAPGLGSRDFEILDVALLCLRFQNRCGLGLNQTLLFLNGHWIIIKRGIKMNPLIRYIVCMALGMGLGYLWPGTTGGEQAYHPSLSEVVLFGIRPIQELDQAQYPEQGRLCVKGYLAAIPPESPLLKHRPPSGPDDAVEVRQKNMSEQIVAILGENARNEGALFASAVPLSAEWEGMSEGPVDEANFVDNWLSKRPESSIPIAPFLHLFKAHRLRAGYEAAKFEHEKGLWPILAKRYSESIAKAKSYGNPLISCIADDLDTQPYVYLENQGRP
jgi:hypothetical protein